jgi:Domain of unknown function (DUF397).
VNKPSPLKWRKSTRSGSNVNTECVEVAGLYPVLAVRDSKDPDGPILTFQQHEFKGLLDRVKNGQFEF